ncbi:MAG: hypothetical protein KIH10_16355 [Candidatus Freyarchaeota archaeon]|nr:hypothetical protein [Candidatus Jordarchaeia archaeon]MBS7281142.1 hypothetical protein [Candidatus Jordarchaeia archaeon]
MPWPVDAESAQVFEEGRSIIGSLITRLIALVHRILDEVLKVSRQFITYASEHPLAMTLLVANIMVWVT